MSNVALVFSELRQGCGRAPRCSQPQRDPPAALTSSPGACGSCESRPPMELPQPHASKLPDACVWDPREPAAGGAPRRVRAGAVRGGHVGSRRGPSAASWWCAVADQRSFRQVPPVPRLSTPPHRQRARLGPGDSDLQGTSTCAACAVAPHKESGS